MRKVLIISKFQFGYHTDVTKWSQYLADEYDVLTITYNNNEPKVIIDGVKNIYCNDSGPRTLRGLRFIIKCFINLLFFRGIVIVCCFPGCHILKWLLPWKRMILDIRTLSVYPSIEARIQEDAKISRAVRYFDNITAISEGVAVNLNTHKDVKIIPLGADVISKQSKDYSVLRLLYIGTFNNRNIDQTILGFKKALELLPCSCDIHYDIVGNGANNELDAFRKLVADLKLEDKISLHGYVPQHKLKPFLDHCNIGVSYIPITPYFDNQPPTKTYEYALSGLYGIATKTSANKRIICEDNGILIENTAYDFSRAILEIYRSRSSINEQLIRKSLQEYEWEKIINNILKPYLKELYK